MTPARLSAISDGLFDGRNKPYVWERALFCWVTNCLHQYDIGGIPPGSFCPAARDAFDECILIPPVKIVEGDCVRRDIEELYLRASRKPAAVALDFRAQLAGNTTARDRVVALIRRYGAGAVKAVMKRILDNGERAFYRCPAGFSPILLSGLRASDRERGRARA